MRTNKRKKYIPIVLFVILAVGLVAGLTFGKYAGEWKNPFGLLISPVGNNNVDTTLRRYFRSNELFPESESDVYAINGTSGWFTVANALDTNTVSQDTVNYTVTWYVLDGTDTWTEYKKQNGSFAADVYRVDKYEVAPVTINGIVYDNIKVVAKTSSFLQEDIEAVYSFSYSDYQVITTHSNGVFTVIVDTNDMPGNYLFTWPAGIVPDNSDPNRIFTSALLGPSSLTARLNANTEYEFLFFVADSTLFEEPFDVTNVIGVSKK